MKWLEREGLLNVDSTDLAGLQGQTEPSSTVGFCSSDYCNRYLNSRRGVPRIFNKATSDSICPKCWTKIGILERFTQKEIEQLKLRDSEIELKKEEIKERSRLRYTNKKTARLKLLADSIK